MTNNESSPNLLLDAARENLAVLEAKASSLSTLVYKRTTVGLTTLTNDELEAAIGLAQQLLFARRDVAAARETVAAFARAAGA